MQPLPHDGDGEVAVRLLGERQVHELGRVAQEGQLVLVAAAALELAGVGQQQARLADQIEREVGEPQVLFERRRVPDPFAEALAEHQRGIAEAQHVAAAHRLQLALRLGGVTLDAAHRFLTSSGIT